MTREEKQQIINDNKDNNKPLIFITNHVYNMEKPQQNNNPMMKFIQMKMISNMMNNRIDNVLDNNKKNIKELNAPNEINDYDEQDDSDRFIDAEYEISNLDPQITNITPLVKQEITFYIDESITVDKIYQLDCYEDELDYIDKSLKESLSDGVIEVLDKRFCRKRYHVFVHGYINKKLHDITLTTTDNKVIKII